MNDDWDQWPPIEGNSTGEGAFLIFVFIMAIILGPIVLFLI